MIFDKEDYVLFITLGMTGWFQYNEKLGRKLKIINNNFMNNYDKNKTYTVVREDLGGRTIHWIPEIQIK
jgi:hypothetical protein